MHGAGVGVSRDVGDDKNSTVLIPKSLVVVERDSTYIFSGVSLCFSVLFIPTHAGKSLRGLGQFSRLLAAEHSSNEPACWHHLARSKV